MTSIKGTYIIRQGFHVGAGILLQKRTNRYVLSRELNNDPISDDLYREMLPIMEVFRDVNFVIRNRSDRGMSLFNIQTEMLLV